MMSSLTETLRELAAHGGDDIKTDLVMTRTTGRASGDITQDSAIQLRNDYDYYVTEIRVGITPTGGATDTVDADADDFDQIRFNIRESGAGQNFFTTDVELTTLCHGSYGNTTPISFSPSGYKVRAGAGITVTLTRRASTITAARVVVVCLVCTLVPKNFHQRARKAF